MSRSKPANDAGPKAEAKRDDRADLLVHHLTRIRLERVDLDNLQTAAKEAKAKVTDKQATITDMFHEAKADTRLDREDIEWALNAMTGGGRRLIKHQRDRAFICEVLGYPYQPDMLPDEDKTPAEARDEIDWNTDGFLAGRRAGEPTPPKDCPERFCQAWMDGYHTGQAKNGEALTRAKVVIEARNKPIVDPSEDEEHDEEEELDEAAKRLKSSDFMKTGTAGGDDSAAETGAAA